MVWISNFFIDFERNEKIITKFLEFQNSSWNISLPWFDREKQSADSILWVSDYQYRPDPLLRQTKNFILCNKVIYTTLCYKKKFTCPKFDPYILVDMDPYRNPTFADCRDQSGLPRYGGLKFPFLAIWLLFFHMWCFEWKILKFTPSKDAIKRNIWNFFQNFSFISCANSDAQSGKKAILTLMKLEKREKRWRKKRRYKRKGKRKKEKHHEKSRHEKWRVKKDWCREYLSLVFSLFSLFLSLFSLYFSSRVQSTCSL